MLEGNIPTTFGNLTNLQGFPLGGLFLHDNMLEGPIPTQLGNLVSTPNLWLHNNMLEGSIPEELCNLSNLETNPGLQLQNNRLSGCIPACFYNNNFCANKVSASANPLLPWEGDFAQYCANMGGNQVGAPCVNVNTPGNDAINASCVCTVACLAYVVNLSGDSTICNGQSATITFNFTGGTGPYDVVWSGGGPLNNISNGHTVTVNPTVTTIYTITSATDNAGCAATIGSSVTVTVNALAAASLSASPNTICQGGSATITFNFIGGTSPFDVVWNNGTLNDKPDGHTETVMPTINTTYAITSAVDANGCSATIGASALVTVTPLPSFTMPPNGTTCSNVQQTYTVTNIQNATTLSWSIPGGGADIISGGDTPSATIGNWTGQTPVSINFTATDDCGNSSIGTFSVVVTLVPATPDPVTGDNSVCIGTTSTYSVPAVPGATTYSWSLPPGATIQGASNQNTVQVNFAGASSGDLCVTAGNSCGTSSPSCVAITVNTLAEASLSADPDTICLGGSSATITFNFSGGAPPFNVVWTGGTLNGVFGGDTETVMPTISTTYAITSAVDANGCSATVGGSALVTVINIVNLGVVSGPLNVCEGSTHTYTVVPVAGVTYNWSVPAGVQIMSAPPLGASIQVSWPVGATSGDVCAQAQNACGFGTQSCTSVNFYLLPQQPDSIVGNDVACRNRTVTYSIPPAAGANGYIWTAPPNATIASGQNTTSVDVFFPSNAQNGNLQVRSTSTYCGSSSATILPITVVSQPTILQFAPGNNGAPCEKDELAYGVVPQAAIDDYQWTHAGGGNVTNGQGTSNVTINWNGATAGGLTVVGTSSVCGNTQVSVTQQINVKNPPDAPDMITGEALPCLNDTFEYSVALVAGATSYEWVIPTNVGNIISGQNTAKIKMECLLPGGQAGTISVVAKNNCGSSASTDLTIVSNEKPTGKGKITGPATTLCAGNQYAFNTIPIAGATKYKWIVPAGVSIVGNPGGTNVDISFNASGSFQICVAGENVCGAGDTACLNVVVNQGGPTLGMVVGDATFCPNSTLPYSIAPVLGAQQYIWSVPSGASIVGASDSSQVNVLWGNSGGQVQVQVQNNCGISTPSIKQVTPIPGSVVDLGPDTILCPGDSLLLLAGPVGPAYEWSTGENTSSVWIDSSNDYSVTVTAAVGCTAQDAVNVQVGVFGPPECVKALILPDTNAGVSPLTPISWLPATGCPEDYTLELGTNTGSGWNSETILMNDVSYYQAMNPLPENANIRVILFVSNAFGQTLPCDTFTFTTGVIPCPDQLNCKPGIEIVLPASCMYTLQAADILGNANLCPERYIIEQDTTSTLCNANGNWFLDSIISLADLNKTRCVRISDTINGSTCTSVVTTISAVLDTCPTPLSPLPNASGVPLMPLLAWSPIDDCITGYYISMGTGPGLSDLYNNVVVNGNEQSWQVPSDLPGGSDIYVRIVPFNSIGAGTGCDEYRFKTQCPGFNAALTLDDLQLCSGDSTVLDIDVTGGTPPYTAILSSGMTPETFSFANTLFSRVEKPISSVDYTLVSVFDSKGCDASTGSQVSLIVHPLPQADAGQDKIVCQGEDVILVASGGNDYQWSNGGPATADWVLPQVPPDNYMFTVTVTDLNGCVNTDQIDVSVNPTPLLTTNSDTVLCAGQPVTLTAQGNATTYQWSPGGPSEDSWTFPSVQSLTYSVVATLQNCTATAQVTILVNDNPAVGVVSVTNALCGSTNGGVSIAVVDGNPPYTYNWSNSTTDQDLVNVPAGIYTVTVTDAQGCSGGTQANIQNQNGPTAQATSAKPSVCISETIELTASGGNSYEWSGPNGFTATGSTVSIPDANLLMSGPYYVTVYDVNNCTDVGTVDITVNPLPDAQIVPSANILTCANSTITLVGSGGDIFEWSNGTNNTDMITVQQSENYVVTVTDSNTGCRNTAQFFVMQDILSPAVSATGGTIDCTTSSITIVTNTNASNPAFSWSGPGGYNSAEQSPLVGEEGTYTLTVTDQDNGCTATATATVVNNAAVVASIASPQGNTITCTSNTIILQASGGNQVKWSTGETTSQIVISTGGLYRVTVTDAGNGCSDQAEILVDVNTTVPSISSAGGILDCQQTSIQLNSTTNAQLPVFAWTGPGTFTSSEQNPTVSEPGVYTLIVTDESNGCSADLSVSVTQDAVTPTASANSSNTLTCQTDNATLQLTTNVVSPLVVWTGPGGFTANVPQPLVTLPGLYTAVITETTNGCTTSAQVTVLEDKVAPSVSINANPNKLTCKDSTIALEASTVPNTVTYSWSGPLGFSSSMSVPSVSVSGVYDVTVTDVDNGCVANASIEVQSDTNFSIDLIAPDGDTINCFRKILTLSVQGGDEYAWSNNLPNGPTVSITTPGVYSVTVTEETNGCVDSAKIQIEIDTIVPKFTLTPTATTCGSANGSITLDGLVGTPPFDFFWSNGDATQNLTGLPVGPYSVLVTGNNFCSTTRNTSINGTPPLSSASIVYTCDSTALLYTVGTTLSGGVPPYLVVSGNGSITGNLFTGDPVASGTAYSLVISDASGCPPIAIAGIFSCPCSNNAGQMLKPTTVLTACGTTKVNAQHNGQQMFQSPYALYFALHEGSGTQIFNPIAFSSTPEFAYQNGISYGETYYISPVVSTQGLNGNPDLGDPCLAVSAGIPVRFYREYAIEISDSICKGKEYKLGQQLLSVAGEYEELFTSAQGCDSLVILELEILDVDRFQAVPDEDFHPPGEKNMVNYPVLANDTLNGEVVLSITNTPTTGDAIGFATVNGDSIGYRLIENNFRGKVSIEYKVCSTECPDLCDTGLLILIIQDAIELVEKDIPNAFSPDGNGINDVWTPLKPYVEQSYQIEKAELSIINKWGELLFHDSKNFSLNSSSDDYYSLGWDGEVSGQVVPSGTYYFSLRLVAGKEIIVTRSLTVIR